MNSTEVLISLRKKYKVVLDMFSIYVASGVNLVVATVVPVICIIMIIIVAIIVGITAVLYRHRLIGPKSK